MNKNKSINTNLKPSENGISKYIDIDLLKGLNNVKEIIRTLPYIAAIINYERQIIYSNSSLLKFLNVTTLEELLGLKKNGPIECIHSSGKAEICNTLEKCKFCEIIKVITKCQQNNVMVEEECRIAYRFNGQDIIYDFHISATPFYINETKYIILTLKDVSSEKKKKDLEKIFFHDVINSAGNLSGIIDLMKDLKNEKELKDFIDIAYIASKELIEEIILQKTLLAAENKELEVEKSIVRTDELLKEVVTQFQNHPISKNRSIKISYNSKHTAISTDKNILRRILINMLKNAIEDTPEKGEVEIGCISNNSHIDIWVYNVSYIPPEIQNKVFKRQISTKGKDRGLGTYSMKLLTEEYLGGKISFETNEEKGTKFLVKLPV